jgi:hypothetical protein
MKISLNNEPSCPKDRNPSRSDVTAVSIELVSDCDGAECGLTSYDGDTRPGVQPIHCHVVVSGMQPKAGPWYFAASL